MNSDDRFSLVTRILIDLIKSPIPSTQFQILADHVPQLLPCNFLALCLVDPDSDGYLVHGLAGQAGNAMQPRLFSLEEGLAGYVIRQSQPHLAPDLASDPHHSPDLEGICCRLGLSSALVAPLIQGERAVGALYCATKTPAGYTQEDLQLATVLATGLSDALENARVYQLLADEHSMLQAVLRSTQDAILLVNLQGIILMANPAVRDMLGFDEESVIGKPLKQAIDSPQLHHLLDNEQSGVVEMPLTNGRHAQANLVPVATSFGEPVGWAAILRDITVFKELEQMKNDFVNTVSHDLKNPISSIMLSGELLAKAGELNDRQESVRKRLMSSARFMETLVSDLLDLGKAEAGLNINKESFDLVTLVRDVVEDQRPRAEASGQTLLMNSPSAAPYCGDPRWLRHVVVNLVSNAMKYTPDGGRVEVTIRRTAGAHQENEGNGAMQEGDGSYVLSVIDNGIGIPATALPHIFDKFYRVQNVETQQAKGTGLGLSIVKSIVEALGGTISVRSEEGRGSAFSVFLSHPNQTDHVNRQV